MPGPVGRPAETVSPDVSECSRMPDSRRPAARATRPWAPSCAIVTTCRVGRHSTGERTSTAATAAVPSSTSVGSSGTVAVTRAQNSAEDLHGPSQPHGPVRTPGERDACRPTGCGAPHTLRGTTGRRSVGILGA